MFGKKTTIPINKAKQTAKADTASHFRRFQTAHSHSGPTPLVSISLSILALNHPPRLRRDHQSAIDFDGDAALQQIDGNDEKTFFRFDSQQHPFDVL